MTSPNTPSFSLQPVVEEDIPELTAISGLTFETDRHTQLKAAHPTKPYDHAGGTPDSIRHWLSLPQRVEATKAVDNATGQIVGSVGWVFRGFDRDSSTAGAVDTPRSLPSRPPTRSRRTTPRPGPRTLTPWSSCASSPTTTSPSS